jgi:hypothetical protein
MTNVTTYVDTVLDDLGLGLVKPIKKHNDDAPIYSPFRLPIQYLEHDTLHPVPETFDSDLELSTLAAGTVGTGMYSHLFKPSNIFGKQMIQEWQKQFTSNIRFLKDTQDVIQTIGCLETVDDGNCDRCDTLMNVWKDAKETPNFLEHYCYLDWQCLVHLNRSPKVLQFLSVSNVFSPVFSLLLPLLFLAVPFLILKLRGLPITFQDYITILKDVAKNHFIGKAITSMENMTVDKAIYLIFTIFLFGNQIYQNINICSRFYCNIERINRHLIHLRTFLIQSSKTMDTFIQLNQDKVTYEQFCKDCKFHASINRTLIGELSSITPHTLDIDKMMNVGYMLKCWYEVHSNLDYEDSIRFTMGFEGYIDNLKGIYGNLKKNVNFIQIHQDIESSKSQPILKDQVYPPISDTIDAISNTCTFDKNVILTGPNASGKTTLLKTTLINILFSQQVGCGFYAAGSSLSPYTHIHSYLNIPDTSERDSLFQAEARRCKDILDIIQEAGDKSRHFCIFDELYSGTNPSEATKAAKAFLMYLSSHENVHFMLTTHYVNICKSIQEKLEKSNEKSGRRIRNQKMNVIHTKDGGFKYTYQIVKGISRVEGAFQVLGQLNYPKRILDEFSTSRT